MPIACFKGKALLHYPLNSVVLMTSQVVIVLRTVNNELNKYLYSSF